MEANKSTDSGDEHEPTDIVATIENEEIGTDVAAKYTDNCRISPKRPNVADIATGTRDKTAKTDIVSESEAL